MKRPLEYESLLPGVLPQMAEHYLAIPPQLRIPLLEYLNMSLLDLPRGKPRTFVPQQSPEDIIRPYRRIAVDFAIKYGFDPGEKIEVGRHVFGMIEGLSQEDVSKGLDGLFRTV